MPCANRKTHSKVFAVCSQPTHGEVKWQTAGGGNRKRSVAPSCSLPWAMSMPCVCSWFAVCQRSLCAVHLRRVPTFAVCHLPTIDACAVCREHPVCRVPEGLQYAVCPVSQHGKDSIQ
jgi:hypothetical protein